MNYCRGCRTDFAAVGAFDRHRAGVHGYLFAEGLDLDPPREDGRRCLDKDEMLAAGMEQDGRGRWRIVLSDRERNRLSSLRGLAESACERKDDPQPILRQKAA